MSKILGGTFPGAKASPRPTGLQLQESLKNRQNEEKQMMAMSQTKAGAASAKDLTWNSINWLQVSDRVRRLQMRIAKATREGRYGKVKALQWLLTQSLSAKLFSILFRYNKFRK